MILECLFVTFLDVYLQLKHYRFSISWSRIFRDGTNTSYNPQGMQYYHNLVDELIANDIIPMVTLYHWDLPQYIQNQGGWINEYTIEYFVEYARKCFSELGPKVKWWITHNEPYETCWSAYGLGEDAPGFKDHPGTYPYLCAHNIIRSHAAVWHMYDKEFRATQNGEL